MAGDGRRAGMVDKDSNYDDDDDDDVLRSLTRDPSKFQDKRVALYGTCFTNTTMCYVCMRNVGTWILLRCIILSRIVPLSTETS